MTMKWMRILGLAVLLVGGCSRSERDRDVKQTITTRARAEPAYAGVSYSVSEGMVTLGGSCPTQKEKEKILRQVSGLAGVNGVIDHIRIAPVTLTADFSLKQAADSVLMHYARVLATVQDSVITLHGTVEKAELEPLLHAMGKLGARDVRHRLTH